MIENKNIDASVIAQEMIATAKDWDYLREMREKGKMVFVPVLRKDGSFFYEHQLANPGSVARQIKEKIAGMDKETREKVFAEIAKIANEVQKQIAKNGGSYLCPAGKTKKACNVLNSFRIFVEEDESCANKTHA